MFHDDPEDSWSYQEIVQKGFDQGFQKGLDQRKLLLGRPYFIRIIEKCFPPLLPLAQKKVALLKTMDDLNSAFDKLLDAQTIEQARQVLEEIKKQPHS
jgi:flagellar biosynthesis/type III secretory pathway protein FliH